MPAEMKPLKFYTHREAFTPRKTELILKLLCLPFKTIYLDWETPACRIIPPSASVDPDQIFSKRNLSGRVPFIYDPNSDVALSESNAITKYLCETYGEEEHCLGFPSDRRKRWEVNQWLDFQTSAQNVIFQQAYILCRSGESPEYLKTLQAMMKRTIGSIDRHLGEGGRECLVNDDCDIADLCWLHWDCTLSVGFGGDEECGTAEERRKKWPNWAAWHERVLGKDIDGVRVKDVLREQLKEMGHWRGGDGEEAYDRGVSNPVDQREGFSSSLECP